MSKWEMVQLSEIGEIVTGNTPKTSDTENYETHDIPFIKPSDFTTDNIDLTNVEYYISEKAQKKARILPVGSIVVTCIGIIGKTKILNMECAFNQQINAIIPNDNNYNRYISYAILFQKELLQTQANAAVVPIINKTDFSKIRIPLPSLEIQRQIAATLDKVTYTIALCNAILEKLDLLVKARFVEMFGDMDDRRTIADICSIITDGTHQPPKFIKSGIPFLFVSNIVTNEITYNAEKFISEETYDELYKRTPIEIGDIVLSTVGSYGHPAVVKTDRKFLFQRHIAYLKPIPSVVNSTYLHSAILSNDAQRQIEERVKGIAQKTLNLSEIRKITVPVAPLALQQQFAAFVEQTNKTKQQVKQTLEKAETLKKALMQEYFG